MFAVAANLKGAAGEPPVTRTAISTDAAGNIPENVETRYMLGACQAAAWLLERRCAAKWSRYVGEIRALQRRVGTLRAVLAAVDG
jgi:hypothetical protein